MLLVPARSERSISGCVSSSCPPWVIQDEIDTIEAAAGGETGFRRLFSSRLFGSRSACALLGMLTDAHRELSPTRYFQLPEMVARGGIVSTTQLFGIYRRRDSCSQREGCINCFSMNNLLQRLDWLRSAIPYSRSSRIIHSQLGSLAS
jgi:hypothetical protein